MKSHFCNQNTRGQYKTGDIGSSLCKIRLNITVPEQATVEFSRPVSLSRVHKPQIRVDKNVHRAKKMAL